MTAKQDRWYKDCEQIKVFIYNVMSTVGTKCKEAIRIKISELFIHNKDPENNFKKAMKMHSVFCSSFVFCLLEIVFEVLNCVPVFKGLINLHIQT